MVLPPGVERELRVAARKSSTYWLRLCAALAVALIWITGHWGCYFSRVLKNDLLAYC
ncbi:MAG TPA: hypothetical protein VL793_07415 [Patescibacteria group bacterium]|nr:hypothetical protein [Patescibacteria group bacterium]